MAFVYFLGRFHVLMLHLPVGILVLAVLFEILVRFRRFRVLEPAVAPIWIAGAVTAVLTMILGIMHATESGFQDSEAVEAHRLAGTLLAATACLIALLRLRVAPTTNLPSWALPVRPIWGPDGLLDRWYAKLWGVGAAAIAALMFVTGHLGGNLTHGDTFLVQYAPTPIRRLAGISPERDPRPKPNDLASADLYLDVVAPAIHQRCDGCHNDSKTSGGLSVADHDKLLKGGEKGPVIVPGDLAKSDLFRRISLSPSDKDYMPKDGKTPLTPEQIAAIGVWIKAGAPKTGAVGELKLTAAGQAAIAKAAALAGDDAAGGGGDNGPLPLPNLPKVDAAPAQAIADLEANGFIVRKADKDSNLLAVDADFVVGRTLAKADLDRLQKVGPQVYTLNLRGIGVTDAALPVIAGLDHLSALRLEENPITDAGAAALAKAKALTLLNLNGSKISDGAVATFAGNPALRRLYAWRTGVTASASRTAGDHLQVLTGSSLAVQSAPETSGAHPPPDHKP